MAQRIYMIPFSDDFTSHFCDLIDAEDDGRLEALFANVRDSAIRHLTTLEVGKLFIDVASEAIPYEKRDERYGIYTACRPYFITCPDSRTAVSRVAELYEHATREELFSKYLEEAKRIPEVEPHLWKNIDCNAELDLQDELWEALLDDIRKSRAMRTSFLRNDSFTIEVPKMTEIAGIECYSQDETETKQVKGKELGEYYGGLVGPTFGRIAGLCSPSWWLGRNFWLGLILGADLGRFAWATGRPARRIQQRLGRHLRLSASLLEQLEIPGFRDAFSPLCAGYSTGLYIPAAEIDPLLELFEHDFDATVDLASRATGYSRDDAAEMSSILIESLVWASGQGCGLVEGDELVGSLGYR